jgi:hypothetical protein
MGSIPRRRLTLTDAVVLIAATAVGLTLLRPALSTPRARQPYGKWQEIEYSVYHCQLYGTPILCAWSVATSALSFRQPRPSIRRLVRGPGFVVNSAAIMGASCILVHYLCLIAIDPNHRAGTYMHIASTGLPSHVGYFVVGAFLALALCRRFLPGPMWTDRLGWCLGFVWIGMALLSWSRLYLMTLK